MSVIPLKQLSYDDARDIKRIIDALNANFRYLDWLLNQGNLDSINIDSTNIIIKSPETGDTIFDHYGVNPMWLKYYPNKCWNSSFEGFDETTKRPKYWSGGVSDNAATYDNTYAMKLTPGQSSQQIEEDGEGLADPAWWNHINTRISFKQKHGAVRVSVHRYSDNVALTLINEKGNRSTYIDYLYAVDWPAGYRTFAVENQPGTGKIYLKFTNIDSTNSVYIDAVQIEPDFTGKWPSFYTHGPRSIGKTELSFETRVAGGEASYMDIPVCAITALVGAVMQTVLQSPSYADVPVDAIVVLAGSGWTTVT